MYFNNIDQKGRSEVCSIVVNVWTVTDLKVLLVWAAKCLVLASNSGWVTIGNSNKLFCHTQT